MTISVITPNYNQAQLLTGAIESVLSQSVVPLEYIIIDDCSTDDSVAVVQQYARRHSFVRLVRRTENCGAIRNVNNALATLRGTHCICLAADDKVLPGCFASATQLLNQHPQAGLFLADVQILSSHGRTRSRRLGLSREAQFFPPREVARTLFNQWPHGQAIVRLDALRAVGGYREELRWHCDWFALWAICLRYGFCYAPILGTAMRVAASTYSANGRHSATQATVLRELLSLLETPEYADLADELARANAMSHFGTSILIPLLRRPHARRFVSGTLLATVGAGLCYNMAARITPRPIKRWVSALAGVH